VTIGIDRNDLNGTSDDDDFVAVLQEIEVDQ
jgi:hypothetical protein